jgi:hypothetical protein
MDAVAFPFAGRPLGFNFDQAFDSQEVMTEAAPNPLCRIFHQSSRHRIAMYVPQLLNPFRITPDIEIIVAWQPEGRAFGATQALRYVLLEHL